MKNIAIAIVLFITIGQLKAQENYTQPLKGVKKVKISSDASLSITAHDKNEITIIGENRRLPEKAKGLKAVYAGGSDNTGVGIFTKREGETLIVKNLKGMHSNTLKIYLPKNVNISIERSNLGDIKLIGFSSEIEASTNIGEITLKDITGPVVARTATGEINVVFEKVSQKSPISLISAAGSIDVSLPSNTATNLELKTTMGEIFTDFELAFPKEENNMKIVGSRRTIKTKLNKGGVEISLRSATGNIYLRKQ
ncbi:DUF4097 family beta strand repeat protein [Aquimarina sp. MMG015]|uniref:DUF4097 family beta strand repeat-containing protein n=1 Tax=Aquimarina TaxID=290174 RepID=UPI00041795FA|nr:MULTISPECIES: DUF4097 family beta strand repeat-containing protein [Aquimarina]AXT57071.1 hypothetical protein D1815_15445 [Aquimarina sp. AD1]MBQ4801660.1 DUF4097 family beta strand repeat protein [Aquimarina sp. MMG015]RKN35081.1 hypothetical protein D7035_03500 [Aquimarina sp. AD1]